VTRVDAGAIHGADPVRRTSAGREMLARSAAAVRRNLPAVATLVVLAAVWEVAGRLSNFLYLPPLSAVLSALAGLIADGTIARELAASLFALAVGMVLAIAIGVAIGALMGISPTARATLDVYVDAMMAAPTVAFVPLFILLFGLGFPTRVATVVLFAIFPLILNTQAGVRAADPVLVEMGHSFGARRMQMFRELRLPMAYPHLHAGLRVGVARGVDGMMTGEVLIAAVGLGGLLGRFGNAFTMDKLYAVILILLLMVVVAERIVTFLGWLLVPFGRHGSASAAT
jgi:NitT/TauT family transport system permease protein